MPHDTTYLKWNNRRTAEFCNLNLGSRVWDGYYIIWFGLGDQSRTKNLKEGNIKESGEKIEGQRKIILMGSCNTSWTFARSTSPGTLTEGQGCHAYSEKAVGFNSIVLLSKTSSVSSKSPYYIIISYFQQYTVIKTMILKIMNMKTKKGPYIFKMKHASLKHIFSKRRILYLLHISGW